MLFLEVLLTRIIHTISKRNVPKPPEHDKVYSNFRVNILNPIPNRIVNKQILRV